MSFKSQNANKLRRKGPPPAGKQTHNSSFRWGKRTKAEHRDRVKLFKKRKISVRTLVPASLSRLRTAVIKWIRYCQDILPHCEERTPDLGILTRTLANQNTPITDDERPFMEALLDSSAGFLQYFFTWMCEEWFDGLSDEEFQEEEMQGSEDAAEPMFVDVKFPRDADAPSEAADIYACVAATDHCGDDCQNGITATPPPPPPTPPPRKGGRVSGA